VPLGAVAARLLAATLPFPFLLACAAAVDTERHPALAEHKLELRVVAVAPFARSLHLSCSGALETHVSCSGALETHAVPDVAPLLLARYLAEAIAARGVVVIPADDLQRALEARNSAGAANPVHVARVAAEKFGASAIVLGEVARYRERQGKAAGALRSASVGFTVTLYSAPEGEQLWSAVFDETQQPLTSNLLNALRYPSGGTRWLRAEELARWGAEETVKRLPGLP